MFLQWTSEVQQTFIEHVRKQGGDAKPLVIDLRGCVVFEFTMPPGEFDPCWGKNQLDKFDREYKPGGTVPHQAGS